MNVLNKMTNMTFGLEREFFVGDSIFERESDRVFTQHWICVARAEEFESSDPSGETYRTVSVGNIDLLVIRDRHDRFSAFHNICRHRGTRLVDQPSGRIRNSCVMCPYHAWTYDLNGNLIGAPNMRDVEGFERGDFGLRPVACVNWCGFILVHFNDSSEQFSRAFGPILNRFQPWSIQDLCLGHTLEYRVAANWKLLFQNYNECYHCPSVHPSLNRLTPYKTATNDLGQGAILGGPMELADGFETVSTDGVKIALPFPGLNAIQCRSVYYYTVFPTMFLSAHPDYVMVHRLQRISNGLTDVRCHFLIAKGTPIEELKRAVDQWDEVNRQDWHVCELTQKGILSPAYVPGPYSNLETMLVAFDSYYRTLMS